MDRPTQRTPLDDQELESHALFLRRLARRLVRDAPLAEDVAQETWRAALARPPSRVGSWRGWLAVAARNVARQFARGERRRGEHERRAAAREALPSAADVAARIEAERRLLDAVAELDEGDRALIVLRHFDGLAPRAIAKRMGAPVETVKTRLKRALERLRARLVARGGDSQRLHAGLLLIAKGVTGTVGAAGGAIGLGVIASLEGKVIAAIAVAAGVVVAVRLGGAGLGEKGLERPDSDRPAVDVAVRAKDVGANAGSDSLGDGTSRISDVVAPQPAAPAAAEDPTAVTGRFVDAEGRPIEGVEVNNGFASRDWPPRRLHDEKWPSTRSGADGRFVWRRPTESGADGPREAWSSPALSSGWADALAVRATAWRSGYVCTELGLNGVIGESIDAGDIVLERSATVTGSIALPRGRDPDGATVVVQDVSHGDFPARPTLEPPGQLIRDTLTMRTRADASGCFELGGLPAGKFRLWASLPGSLNTPSDVITLASGEERDGVALRVEFPPESSESLEVVVEGPDGSPIPGAWVAVEYRANRNYPTLSFQADERGGVDVPTHGYEIRRVTAGDPENRLRSSTTRRGQLLKSPCVLRLGATLPVVVCAHSSGDAPLGGVNVSCEVVPIPAADAPTDDENEGNGTSGGSEEGGRVELWMVDGSATLTVHADGFLDRSVGPFRVRDQHDPIDVALTPAPAVMGRVLFEGRPLAGATVSVCQSPTGGSIVDGAPSRAFFTGFGTGTPTSADGTYRVLWNNGGPIYVRAHAPGFAATAIGPLESEPDRSLENVDVELTRGGTLAGTVLPGRDGSMAHFVVISDGDGVPRSWPLGSDGTFRVEHLTPGAWNVRTHGVALPYGAVCGAYDTPARELPSNCIVREGETTTLVITADETLACVVRGVVEDLGALEDGWKATIGSDTVPIANFVARPDPNFSKYEVLFDSRPRSPVAPDGSFEIRSLYPGCSKIVVWHEEGEGVSTSWCAWSQPLDAKQGLQTWRAKLPNGRIEGQVVFTGPRFSSFIAADATTADGLNYEAQVSIDAAGRFTIAAAPPGDVHLHCGKIEGHATVTVGSTTTITLR